MTQLLDIYLKMTPDDFEKLNEKHPYLTYIQFLDEDLIGIIQNVDNQLVSIYSYTVLANESHKKQFLKLGQLWWEQSNQLIPIDIFLRDDFKTFKHTLKCLPRKDVKQILGPTLSMEHNFQKRIKRRRIQLVRNGMD